MRTLAVVVALIGCGSKTDAHAAGSGSGLGSGSASATGSGSASGSGSGSSSTKPPADAATVVSDAPPVVIDAPTAKTGARTPPVEMAWPIRGRAMKVTVVDVDGPPEVSKLIVAGDGPD